MKRILRNVLLAGLTVCAGVVIYPAAAPSWSGDFDKITVEKFNDFSDAERMAIIEHLIRNNGDAAQWTFFEAVECGWVWALTPLIEKGATVDAVNSDGDTALHMAALNGHEGVVRFLVGAGAAVDGDNRYGDTALDLAVRQGHEEIVRFLVSVGALKNFEALHKAVLDGYEEIVKILVTTEANKSDQCGDTALHLAARNQYTSSFDEMDNVKMVKILLEGGAEIGIVNDEDQTALEGAAKALSGEDGLLTEKGRAIITILINAFRAQLERAYPTRQYMSLNDEEVKGLTVLLSLPRDIIELVMDDLSVRDFQSLACVSKAHRGWAYNEMCRIFPAIKRDEFEIYIEWEKQRACANGTQAAIVPLLEQAWEQCYVVAAQPAISSGE